MDLTVQYHIYENQKAFLSSRGSLIHLFIKCNGVLLPTFRQALVLTVEEESLNLFIAYRHNPFDMSGVPTIFQTIV